MLKICPSAFECGVCMHGTADPAKDESVFDRLRDRSWRERYDVQGEFNDGDEYLSEVCVNGHMLCEKCHVSWERKNNKCPFCRSDLIPSRDSRKMQVFHTDEIAEQQTRNNIFGGILGHLARIPRTLLQGGFNIRIFVHDWTYCGFRSFMPPCYIRPQPYESTTRYLLEIEEPDMTVAAMMRRMQMYSNEVNHPVKHERIDAYFWKLCIVSKQLVNGFMMETYQQIDSNLRIVDIPEFVFDYQTRNLAIFMDLHEARWSGLIMPGIAGLDQIARLAHINNQRTKEIILETSARRR